MQMELQRWETAFVSHKVHYRWEAAACRQLGMDASAPHRLHPKTRWGLRRVFWQGQQSQPWDFTGVSNSTGGVGGLARPRGSAGMASVCSAVMQPLCLTCPGSFPS